MNQTPEQIARDKIDQLLSASGWTIQDKKHIDLSAGNGVAVREYYTDIGPADYILFSLLTESPSDARSYALCLPHCNSAMRDLAELEKLELIVKDKVKYKGKTSTSCAA